MVMRMAVRNLGGASYAGSRYRSVEAQQRGLNSVIDTSAKVVLLQEVVRLGDAVRFPSGWRTAPSQPEKSDWGSVVAVADDVGADLSWRPSHPVLDACGSYLDSRFSNSAASDCLWYRFTRHRVGPPPFELLSVATRPCPAVTLGRGRRTRSSTP